MTDPNIITAIEGINNTLYSFGLMIVGMLVIIFAVLISKK